MDGYIKVKKGKTWNSIGSIKSHLSAVAKWDKFAFSFYDNWQIIKISENGIEIIGVIKDLK
jgi:hypothetical protein